ncbi:hypothetical protein [Stenotrophomonas acidaminiphila]|nr:hypothetical protein [Stenotrophomonas acidaminiphila]
MKLHRNAPPGAALRHGRQRRTHLAEVMRRLRRLSVVQSVRRQ